MSPIQNFLSELKRRNVVRAGAAYVVLAWLVIQVADILFETFAAPIWLMQGLVIALAAGLPVTLVGAWVYELTREGLKRTVEVDFAESITNQTRR
jgi:predicted membrane channel-forming protein YqfA (hemolysin III family)